MRGIAIDVGQTGVRLRVDQGPVLETASAGVGGGSVPRLVAAIEALFARSASASEGNVAGAGVTGDYESAERTALARGLRSILGVDEVRLAHDSVTALLGATGSTPAVVTMCGTGAVTLGFDGDDLRRYDGFGPLGDWGGGAALGMAGVRAGVRALDGVGPATRLGELISAEWPSPAELHLRWRREDAGARGFVAGFARSVVDSAVAGDRVANALLAEAAEDAASTTTAAVRALGVGRVSYGGAMLRDVRPFREAWVAAVRLGVPSVRIVDPAGDGLDGARRLCELPVGQLSAWHVTRDGHR